MECTQCQAANRDGARFCSRCGAALAILCSTCGTELASRAKFCDQCGAPTSSNLGAADPFGSPAAAKPAGSTHAGAVRKTVTVLFCDLGGSTSFGERTDPETTREVMARYHALLQEVIDTHGGTVAKFMGDGMMATFGIPEIAEDDAVRAVQAGVDMHRRFTEFAAPVSAQHGETLTLRVGVNTGEVVIASGDADLIGDALNVAARLEHACRPGHVLVGEDTWRLTRGDFAYESLGEVTVTGREQAVPVYEVRSGNAAAVETAAPFVGRALEMHRLNAVFDMACSAPGARLVTVLGSPGVGKTRLSRELCASVEMNANALTFEVRCDRAGDATFAPVGQLIREATGLGDDADVDLATTSVGALLADEPDRERLTEILSGLVGAAPARSVEETFWAIRRLLTRLAASRPVVLVIDDIQWAEPLLLDLLDHLAEWVHEVPVVLLCLARPELREVRPALAEPGRRVEDVLALDGLDSAATEQLAAGLLGTDHLPAALVARLPASTDGNPLFVRELVRMLVDDQVIRLRDGEWELAIDADAVEVPPTIQSLLATRVERLPNDERGALELASVIGAEFSLGALRELAGDDAALPSLLERMRRKELVEPTGTYWGDEPVHRFHHVLIRDSAYRRLLKTARAELHERVAVWTDANASGLIGEHEAVIAYHYEQAYQYRVELGTVDDHARDLGRRAAELLSTAADRALGRDDLASAGALARRALALLPGHDATARSALLLIACECLLSSGDVAASRSVVEELRAEAGTDPSLGAWAACFEAQLIGLTDPEGLVEAEATATSAAAVMAALADRAGEAKAHQVRAALLARLGRVGDAELELDLALGAARRVDDRRRVTAVLGAAPGAALWGPSPVARAGGRCLDVVRLLRITTASPSVEATSMRCQAVLEALRGRFDVSRSMLASARTSLEELGLRHGLLETEYLAGVVELIAGDPAAALQPLRAAYRGFDEMGVGLDAGRAAALLARAFVALADVDNAEPMATASESLAGQDLKTKIAWRVARGEVLAARGDAAAGVVLVEQAVAIASGTDLIIDHADACVALADLREAMGDAVGAQQARADARRLYEAKGATVPAERLAALEPPTSTHPAPDASPTAGAEPGPVRSADARPGAQNAMTRAWEMSTGYAHARRWDQLRLIIADGLIRLDRRRGISSPPANGPEEFIASYSAWFDVGFDALRIEPVAVRGDRIALGRFVFSADDGREVALLCVSELDEAKRICRAVQFDEDALAEAVAELDSRYLAGALRGPTEEPATTDAGSARAENAAARVAGRLGTIAIWETTPELFADDIVMDDRRRVVGMPAHRGRGAVMAANRAAGAVGLSTGTGHALAVRGERLCLSRASSPTPEGYEVKYLFLNEIDEHGRLTAIVYFDDDALAEAVAELDARYLAGEGVAPSEGSTPVARERMHEPGSFPPPMPGVENQMSRAVCVGLELLNRREVETERGRNGIAPDVVRVDRRRGVSAPTVHDQLDFIANAAAVYDVFGTVTPEVIAVRGERLALVRLHCGDAIDGFELQLLCVYEANSDGQLVYEADFDGDDLVGAFNELEDRWCLGEGAHDAYMIRRMGDAVRAHAARDWRALAALSDRELTAIDHRQLGFPLSDAASVIEMMKALVELVPDAVLEFPMMEIAGDVALVLAQPKGTTADGSRYEWSMWFVWRMAAGLANHMEYFDADDGERARARFEELAAEIPASDVDNAACRALVRGNWLGDFGASGAPQGMADDLVVDDRRRGVSLPELHGAEEVVRATRAQEELFGRTTMTPIAVRGDRLVLVKTRAVADSGFELGSYGVFETNAAGQFVAMVFFDEDDLPGAMQELEARYLPSTDVVDVPSDAVMQGLANYESAFAARDWDWFTGSIHPEIVSEDRRTGIGFGIVPGRDALVELTKGLAEVGFETVDNTLLAVRGGHLLLTRRTFRTSTGFDLELIALLESDDDGQLIRHVQWDPEDLTAGVAELEQRAAALAAVQPTEPGPGT